MSDDVECNSWNNIKQLLYTWHFREGFKEAFVLRYKEFGGFFWKFFLRNCDSVLRAYCPQTRVAVLVRFSLQSSPLGFTLPAFSTQICLQRLVEQESICPALAEHWMWSFGQKKRLLRPLAGRGDCETLWLYITAPWCWQTLEFLQTVFTKDFLLPS